MLHPAPLEAQQSECVHTYREPGCVGGKECVRREVVPCDAPEPSTVNTIKGKIRELLPEIDKDNDPFGFQNRSYGDGAPRG